MSLRQASDVAKEISTGSLDVIISFPEFSLIRR